MDAKITFDYDKSTKGTHRYKEQGDRAEWLVGTLYVKRTAFEGVEPPPTLNVYLTTETLAVAPDPVDPPVRCRGRKAS